MVMTQGLFYNANIGEDVLAMRLGNEVEVIYMDGTIHTMDANVFINQAEIKGLQIVN